LAEIKSWGDVQPQRITVAQWVLAVEHITSLQAAGYHVSPIGECEGDVYVEVEEEAVGLWQELIANLLVEGV